MSYQHEYLLGPGDRVRFQEDVYNGLSAQAQAIMKDLRGVITSTDETARECAYHEVDWNLPPNFDIEEFFNMTKPLYIDLGDMIQGDELEPAPVDEHPLLSRHSESVVQALKSAITALYLYDGAYITNRSVRGAFYDIVEALDEAMFVELQSNGADWVHAKYFAEEDENEV